MFVVLFFFNHVLDTLKFLNFIKIESSFQLKIKFLELHPLANVHPTWQSYVPWSLFWTNLICNVYMLCLGSYVATNRASFVYKLSPDDRMCQSRRRTHETWFCEKLEERVWWIDKAKLFRRRVLSNLYIGWVHLSLKINPSNFTYQHALTSWTRVMLRWEKIEG